MRRHALLAALGALCTSLVLVGCSDAKSAPEQSPAQVLTAAKKALDSTSGVTFLLASNGVPSGVNGVTTAKGQGVISATEPKFKGTIGATVKGVAGQVELIAIGKDTWWKFFTPGFVPVNLADLGAPNPAALFNPDTGISTLLTGATNPVKGEQTRVGHEVLTTYTGKVPGSAVKSLLMLGDGTGTFEATFGIADNGQLRTATLKGPFFTGATSTYVLTVQDYGQAVVINKP